MATAAKIHPSGPYRYTESGLDNVWLANGFQYSDGPGGLQVSFEDIDGLHRAIGETLVTRFKRLSGREVRFLRQELSLGQGQLARLLGVSERAVARWERASAGHVPGPAETALRMLYRDFISDGAGPQSGSMRRMLKAIADMEAQTKDVTMRKPNKANWRADWSSAEDRQLDLSAM